MKTMILEISKRYCEKFYDGNIHKMIEAEDGVLYDDERIRNAFNHGNGTTADFRRHMKANKVFCKYYDLTTKRFI